MGIAAGIAFSNLPDSFLCPICGMGKEKFVRVHAPASVRTIEPTDLVCPVTEIIPRTASITSFRFGVPAGLSFRAGQYLLLSLGSADGLTKPLSISSSPTEEGYLEVTKRLTLSAFSDMLRQLKPGDEVKLNFPLGSFTFSEELKKVALLSGGIGITPLRSICKHVVDKRLRTNICLLYSNRSALEIPFQDEFASMQKVFPALRVVHTISRPEGGWAGRHGRIDAALIRETMPDYLERCFYVCGPQAMVSALLTILGAELGLPDSQIRSENFTGYDKIA